MKPAGGSDLPITNPSTGRSESQMEGSGTHTVLSRFSEASPYIISTAAVSPISRGYRRRGPMNDSSIELVAF